MKRSLQGGAFAPLSEARHPLARTSSWACEFRFVFTGLWWLAACSSPDRPSHNVEERVTTTFGDTCGEWQTEAGPNRINVACGPGLECNDWRVTNPFPVPNHFGICVPENSTCSVVDLQQCPDERMSCQLGEDALPPGECVVKCEVPKDCLGPFQSCDAGACKFIGCNNNPDACRPGTHCELELCVPD